MFKKAEKSGVKLFSKSTFCIHFAFVLKVIRKKFCSLNKNPEKTNTFILGMKLEKNLWADQMLGDGVLILSKYMLKEERK